MQVRAGERPPLCFTARTHLAERVIEVDQHDHAGLGSDAGERNEADRNGDRHVEAEPPEQPDAADQREWQREHDDERLGQPAEIQVEQQEDDRERHRHDQLEACLGPFEIFELTAPGDAEARGQLDALRDRVLGVANVAAEVAPDRIDEDVDRELAILGPDRGGATLALDACDLAERQAGAGRRRDLDLARDRLRIGAQVARIADRHPVALAPFDRRRHGLAAHRHHDRILDVANGKPVAAECDPVRHDVEKIAADDALGIGTARARDGLQHRLDLARDRLHLGEIGAEHLDPDRRADAGREHVDARADGLRPGVGDAGELERLVHLRLEAVERDAFAPFRLRFQVDDGLEHLGRGRIGRGLGAAGLAVDRGDLREGADDLVLRLEQLGRLGDGDARQGRGHVHQRALVQRRHELRAELSRRPDADAQQRERQQDGQHPGPEHAPDQRPVEPDQNPVDRVLVLRDDPAPDEDHHRRRHQSHRQEGGRRHREGLGVGERPEQATLLPLQREDRQEGDGDHEQAEEQRRPDLACRLDDDLDARLARGAAFEMLVRVLDHDDGGVDHGADRDGDAAQAHDVGAQPQRLHRRERDQDADGQHDDRDQGAAQMQ